MTSVDPPVAFGEPMDEQAAEWKRVLLETVRPHAELPLLLSGGVDSGTILAACLELGHRPHCFAYQLHGTPSADAALAEKMARDYACQFTLVSILRTPEVLEADVRRIIRTLGTSRKTSVQCVQPIMHLAEAMHAEGYRGALVGTGAVVLDDRKVMTILSQRGELDARKYRTLKMRDRYADCGTGRMHEMAQRIGVPLQEPYSDEPLRSHALNMDMKDLNRGPRGYGQKGIAVRAFPRFWTRPGYYRRNVPLQVAGGVREWHEELLADPRLNPDGNQRVVAVYNRILKEENEPHLFDTAGA